MDKNSWAQWSLGGVQWLFFMLANTIVIPLSIGEAFHQDVSVVTASVQRSFLYTGAACLLQALFGHRLPLMEGQSGLWWGVMLSLAAMVSSAPGETLQDIGGSLSVGIIAAGIVIAVLGAIGMGRILKKLFTPVVMSAFLFLLAIQLNTLFFKGMLGISQGSALDIPVALVSVLLVVLVAVLNVKGKGLVSNLALLIGMAVGWGLHAIWISSPAPTADGSSLHLFDPFPLGAPSLHVGILLTCLFAGLLNTTNTVASLMGAETLYKRPSTDAQYRRSFVLSGLNTVVSGLFGLVPYAPYTSSIGFLRSTRILERAPFLIGSALFVLLGAVPALSRFFAGMPISVGDAVLFVAYLQLFGAALQNLDGIRFDFRTVYRIAVPVLAGAAVMNVPSSALAPLPQLIRPLLASGLLVGIMLVIVLENTIRWQTAEPSTQKNRDLNGPGA